MINPWMQELRKVAMRNALILLGCVVGCVLLVIAAVQTFPG